MEALWISRINRRNTSTNNTLRTFSCSINKITIDFIKCPITHDSVNLFTYQPSQIFHIYKKKFHEKTNLSCKVFLGNSRQDWSSSFQSLCMPIVSVPYDGVKASSARPTSLVCSNIGTIISVNLHDTDIYTFASLK